VEPSVTEISRTTNAIACPHCGGEVQFTTRVKIVTVNGEIERSDAPPEAPVSRHAARRAAWLAARSPAQRAFLEEAATSGVLAAFLAACERLNSEQQPSIPEKFLLQTLQHARPRQIPRPLFARILRHVGAAGRVVVYGAPAIYIVTVDGHLKAFIPMNIITAIEGVGSDRFSLEQPDAQPENDGWWKTRFGYVAGRGPLYEEFRHRYLGQFGTAMKG